MMSLRKLLAGALALALIVAPAWCAAAPSSVGKMQNTTPLASQSITLTGPCASGSVLVLWLDVLNTRSIASGAAFTDPRGNTWTLSAATASGSRLYSAATLVGTGYSTSDVITVALTGTGGITITADCFPSASTLQTGGGAFGNATTQSMVTAAITNTGFISYATRFNSASGTCTAPGAQVTNEVVSNYGILTCYQAATAGTTPTVATASALSAYIIGYLPFATSGGAATACLLGLIGVGKC